MLGTSSLVTKSAREVGVAGSVVPNGVLDRQFNDVVQPDEQVGEAAPQSAVSGTVKGSWVVTLNGPLIPNPALADNSVKYSPRS